MYVDVCKKELIIIKYLLKTPPGAAMVDIWYEYQ